jgi:hypothetical protein
MRCKRSGANPTSSGFADGRDAAASGTKAHDKTDDQTTAARSAARRVKAGSRLMAVIWLLNGTARGAEPVEDIGQDAGDFRGLTAFDLATVQHVDWLSILE